MDYKEFAGKVRAKYPGAYDSVDDMTLAQKVVAKYPDYKDTVDFGTTPDTPQQPQDIGALKSGLLGLMSGVPLAETATAAVNAIGPTTYEEEHKKLEDEKNQAWDQHPVAYGSGKAAGFVGTGLVAPASIPGAIGIGAASGIDAAEKPADMISEGLKGGAVGGTLGVIGEKVINPLINKALPALGKRAVASLGEPTLEDVESYLKNPEAIRKALTTPELAEKLAATARGVGEETGTLADTARGLLKPDSALMTGGVETPATSSIVNSGNGMGGTVVIKGGSSVDNAINPASAPSDTIRPLFDELIGRFTQSGVAPTAEKGAAVKALESEYERLSQIAEANGGNISEVDLKSFIKSLQDTVSKSAWGNPDAQESQVALKQLSGKLNGLLKFKPGTTELNEYGQAMKPVADRVELLNGLKDKFSLEEPTRGAFSPTEVTNTKLANVLKEGKTESHDLLAGLKEKTGIDFMDLAKNAKIKGRFDAEGAGEGLKAALATGGFGLGHMTGVPYGGVLGAAAGRLAANGFDGGQVAKRILDAYIGGADSFNNSALKPVMAKYGPILVKAAKAGGNQLAATHFVLATSNPEYQQLANNIGEEAPHQ